LRAALAAEVAALAGAVLAAPGRAGDVVDLAVVPVRLVAVAFRGFVSFAATVTLTSPVPRPAEMNRPFGPRDAVGVALITAGPGSWETLRAVAVVWSRVDRSPAAARGSAEPFVAFAITYARVP
jgi:hypothetical protein